MAGALQSSPLRPYRVFEHICTTTQHAPADGSVCMLGGAPIEVGAPCAGTSNVDDRARIKCDRRLFGAVQVTHQPPSSAADFVGAAREDMRFPREDSRVRGGKTPYEISSGRCSSAPQTHQSYNLTCFRLHIHSPHSGRALGPAGSAPGRWRGRPAHREEVPPRL